MAKNAADLILTDDNFATIVKAIAEGRGIYANIKKAVLFLLSSNFGEIMTMLAAILMNFSSPLKPSHILWINLITDSLPALALGVDPENPAHFMRQPPRPKNENLFAFLHTALRFSDCVYQYGGLSLPARGSATWRRVAAYFNEPASASGRAAAFGPLPDLCIYSAWYLTALPCSGHAGCGDQPVPYESSGK